MNEFSHNGEEAARKSVRICMQARYTHRCNPISSIAWGYWHSPVKSLFKLEIEFIQSVTQKSLCCVTVSQEWFFSSVSVELSIWGLWRENDDMFGLHELHKEALERESQALMMDDSTSGTPCASATCPWIILSPLPSLAIWYFFPSLWYFSKKCKDYGNSLAIEHKRSNK